MIILENGNFNYKSCKKVMESSRKGQLFDKAIFDILEGGYLFEDDFRKFSLNYYTHQNL